MATENTTNTLQLRNEQICKEFTSTAEQQPLASCNSIIENLARKYGVTAAGIRHILRGHGIATSRPTLIQQPVQQ